MSRSQRHIGEALRPALDWHSRWEGPDDGLIAAWEAGRELAPQRPALAEACRAGHLPELPWKGMPRRKKGPQPQFGTLLYLAMWQNLRGCDLDIDLSIGTPVTCTETGLTVMFIQRLPTAPEGSGIKKNVRGLDLLT